MYLEVDEGSYGGRYGKDAIDSCDALVANTRNVPIEEIEWHYPLRVERYELNPAKVAPGKWRGGLGIVRETRFLQDGTVTCEGDRHKEAPKGIFGGYNGTSASMTKIRLQTHQFHLSQSFLMKSLQKMMFSRFALLVVAVTVILLKETLNLFLVIYLMILLILMTQRNLTE